MARLRLKRWEIEDYDLPPVCAKCGQPAEVHPKKTFSWHPPWVIVLILAGLLIYVIVAVILTKRMTVPLPFCERHRNYWRNRSIFIYGGLLGLLLLAVIGVIIASALDPRGQDTSLGLVCVGSGVLFLVWLIAAAIMQTTSIRPNEITDRSITLVGLSRDFVDAVEDDREAAEEEADRRWRERSRDKEDRSRGRGRSTTDEDRYFDPEEKRRGGKGAKDGGYYEPRKEDRSRQRDEDDDY
jgi:hypothetical protein